MSALSQQSVIKKENQILKVKKKGSWLKTLAICLAVVAGLGLFVGLFGVSEDEKTNKDSSGDIVQEYTLTFGNDYNASWVDSENRATIQPYVITIPANTTLTAVDGYLFGFYKINDETNVLSNTMLSTNWVESYVVSTDGKYGITIKKSDDSNFDFSTDSLYISDYIVSSDESIWVLPDEKAE